MKTESEQNYEIWDFHTHPFITDNQQTCMYPGFITGMGKFLEDMELSHISRFAGSVISLKEVDVSSFRATREKSLLGK